MNEQGERVINLTALAKALDVSLASKRGLPELRSLLRDLLIRDDIDVPEEDNDLLTAIVYRLDAMEDDAGLRAEAKAFVPLLSREIPRPKALLLVPLIEGRQRLDELLMRFAQGVMTRKAFEAYLTNQRWSVETKRAISRLPDADLARLRGALGAEDYRAMISLLFAT